MTATTLTATGAKARPYHGRAIGPVRDALAIAGRNLIALRRVPNLLVFSTIQPVVFLLLFRYVFGGVAQTSCSACPTMRRRIYDRLASEGDRPRPAAGTLYRGAGMRHLGILAHSAEGAALCFRAFCQEGFAELGPHQHPDLTLDCIALARSMPAWDRGDHPAIRETLSLSVQRLARAGADFFACPDNTAHLALEQPGEDLALPGLHIAEVVADQAAAEGRRRVGVLGTRYLMDGPLYLRALAARGIAAELPEAADRELVNKIIFEELVNGVFTGGSRRDYVGVIERLAARGCDAVALVCTEIPLLVTPGVSPLPTLDSTRLLARAAFEVAVGRRPLPSWRGGPIAA